MRKERVALKHGVHVPLVGRKRQNAGVVEEDIAVRRVFEPSNDPEQGGFSAAGRPKKGKKFTLLDFDIYIFKDLRIAEAFTDAVNADLTAFHTCPSYGTGFDGQSGIPLTPGNPQSNPYGVSGIPYHPF
jgi:hypothetical protein